MNKKIFRAQQKAIRKRKAKQAFMVALPAPAPVPPVVKATPTPPTTRPQLSPQDEMMWQEIRLITNQVLELLLRASFKVVARALLEGLKEAGTNSSIK
jgi:hypothetical protein